LQEAQAMIGGMWVRLMDWMIADAEPPMPRVGELLSGLGIRVRGAVTPALPERPDGIVEIEAPKPHQVRYQLTGSVIDPRDFEVDGGGGDEHTGAEFVLSVGDDRFQVQFEGTARDIQPGSRVTVADPLSIVGAYEWDGFQLTESRADWFVRAAVRADRGDTVLDLVSMHHD
jgi:hypothetical protein